MRRRLIALGTLLAACGPEPKPSASPEPEPEGVPHDRGDETAARMLCNAYCDRQADCGGGRCACPAADRDLTMLRRSYIGQLTLCLDGASCSSIREGRAWSACHDTAVANLQPQQELRDFCFEASRRAARCGRTDEADQSSCILSFRHVSRAALERASACLERPCAEVPTCVASHLRPGAR